MKGNWFDDKYLIEKLEQYASTGNPIRRVEKNENEYVIYGIPVRSGDGGRSSEWRRIVVTPGLGVSRDWKKMIDYLKEYAKYLAGERGTKPQAPTGLVRIE